MLVQKLKALKVDLCCWNKEIFGDVNFRKNELQIRIQDMDLIEDTSTLSSEEQVTKDQLKAELENVLLFEEINWRQKSRATWLQEGDKNTRFFHRIANSNCRFNTIDRLLVNETVSMDHEEIGEGLVRFYKNLFSDDAVRRPLLDVLPFSSIDDDDSNNLDR